MLDVDVVFGQVEVGLVLPVIPGGGEKLVGFLVGVPDAVHHKEIGDGELLEALDQLAVQAAEFGVPDVLLVLDWGLEVKGCPVFLGEGGDHWMISFALFRLVIMRARMLSMAFE